MTATRRIRLTQVAAGLRPRALSARTAPLRDKLNGVGARLAPALTRARLEKARGFAQVAPRLDGARLLAGFHLKKEAVASLEARLNRGFALVTAAHRDRLDALERIRQTLGYTETLKRGYVVMRGDGEVVTTKKAAAKAGVLEVEFADGRMTLGGGAKPARAKKAPPSDQGSLF